MENPSYSHKPIKAIFLLFFLILYFLFPFISYAQVNSSQGIPTITNYTAKEFRTGGQAWSMGQDHRGFFYLGSNQGIVQYDGKSWELLISPIKGFNTSTRALHKSKSGILYYGSLGDFGYIGEDELGNSRQYSLLSLLPKDFLLNDVWSINEVGEKIYFQAREAIFIYSPEKENQKPQIEIWKPDTEFMYSWQIDEVFYTHQMDLGIFKEVEGKLELVSGSEFLGEMRVQVMLPFNSPGQFLVGGFLGGLHHFDGNSFTPFKTEVDDALKFARLYKGMVLPDKTYALGTVGSGLLIIDSAGRKVGEYTTKKGLVDDGVYSLLIDVSGTLWVGTNNGISKIEISSSLTRFVAEDLNIGSILSLNAMDDELFIGGSKEILYIDKKDGIIKKVPGIPNSQVFDIKKDEDRLLLSNLGLYSIKNGKAEIIPGTEKLQLLKIIISEKHPGYVFLSGSFGISVFKRKKVSNSAVQPYEYEAIGQVSQIERYIYTMEEDKHGNLWAGTQAGNLFKVSWGKTASGNLDLTNTKVQIFTEDEGIPGLAGRVSKIGNRIYTSGINGFYYFDDTSNAFVKDSVFSFSKEIANINIDAYSLQSDDLDRVIIVFKEERKIAVPNPEGSYSVQDNPINLFTGQGISSFYSEPSGVIWLGTDEGLIRIDNQKSSNVNIPFPLYFTRIISNSDTLRHKILKEETELDEMDFENNSIRFNYAAPFFIQEKLTKYQTFLEGFDQDWSKWEETPFREFTNLPYGTYTFRVKAKNIYNTISDEISYSFVILPPWYATWWAYLLYFVGFVLLVFGLVKVQTGRILAKEMERTREKELAQAKEIEKAYDHLKSTQNQLIQSEKMASLGELTAGIAHEIQNPLNFVNNFSEISEELIDEMKEELELGNHLSAMEIADDLKQNLSKIKHHGKRADSIVKGMLQHSRTGSILKEPTNLNNLADEYLRLAYHGLRAKDKSFQSDFKSDLDPKLPLVDVMPQDISRVLLNLINNAFYAVNEKRKKALEIGDETYKPLVTVKTQNSGNTVEISVLDNGSGVPESVKSKIFQPFFTTKPTGQGTGLGLSLSYDIVKAHGGTLELESTPGEFTQFKITLPQN
jgi:signal transduction histidine kinase